MAIIDTRMTAAALTRAKLQVFNVCSQGTSVTLTKANAKDDFGSALTETTLVLKAFPVRYSPYDRETSERISWCENTDILCYVSKKQIDGLNLTTQQLQAKYRSFRVGNKTYDIRYIENYSAFAGDYLYVIFGGKA